MLDVVDDRNLELQQESGITHLARARVFTFCPLSVPGHTARWSWLVTSRWSVNWARFVVLTAGMEYDVDF
jgi:hypothetical protein